MFKWWSDSKLLESSQQNPLNFKIPYIEMEKKLENIVATKALKQNTYLKNKRKQ